MQFVTSKTENWLSLCGAGSTGLPGGRTFAPVSKHEPPQGEGQAECHCAESAHTLDMTG